MRLIVQSQAWLPLTCVYSSSPFNLRAFSQSASLVLHAQLHALRTRHAASLATLTKENEQLRRELNKERREADRTRIRLGQVGEEAWIEAEGRRREIGLWVVIDSFSVRAQRTYFLL